MAGCGAEAAGVLRALPDALGLPVHGGGRCLRQSAAGGDRGAEQAGVWPGLTGERADWGAAVADDLSDDAEGGLRRDWGHRAQAKGADGDAVRELAGKTPRDGLAGLGRSEE